MSFRGFGNRWSPDRLALLKRRLHKGYALPVAMRGLVNVLDKINKAYLAQVPGNSLLNATPMKECMDAAHKYNTEQVQIMSILAVPSPGVILPLLGMTFAS